MNMHNPPHPGEVLKGLYLDPLNVTVTEAALALNVARKTLSGLVNGRSGISPEMALRLAKALNTSPELWLNMQAQPGGHGSLCPRGNAPQPVRVGTKNRAHPTIT